MWAFNVKNKLDANGKPVTLDVDAFSEGFSSHPLTVSLRTSIEDDLTFSQFQSDIKPRFPEAVKVIESHLSAFE